ncbi:hypothetical protein NPJ88_010580 [Halomonas elongata]|uniref:hypothetical protein n=1 Tax=Halomonas elongata TaxID=2746 RepID=UPI00255AF115|nr:hypothetical protein [Halomonas elongata]MDL4862781.1 hypothetical protein [Halomonas elongata]
MPLDPKKIVLCWPNLIDDATLSAGSSYWSEEQPLSLIQQRELAEKARLEDTGDAITIELGTPRPVGVVALAAHNLSASAQYRVIIGSGPDGTVTWDSGAQNVWPSVYATAELEWEYDNFWAGTIEGGADFTPLLTVFIDEVQVTSYIRVAFDDPANPDGYVEIGRMFIGDAWQPEFNISYGITHGYDDTTEVTEAGDRTEYFDLKRRRRTATFSLDYLSEQEAFARLYSLQRTEGIAGEILYAFSSQPSPENFARTFLARQQQLDALSHPYHATHSGSLSLLEIL